MSDSTFAKQHILDSSTEVSPEDTRAAIRYVNNHPAGRPDILDALGLVDA